MGGKGSGRKKKPGRPKGSWTKHPPKRGRPRHVGRPKGIHTHWSKYNRSNRR
jgi:hypothetical protein